MKKTLIYLSIALSCAAVSCNRAELEQPVPGNGDGTGTAIRLGARSADAIRTRATQDGETDYNENLIQTLDYFIYRVNPSTNATTEAVVSGRLTWDGGYEALGDDNIKANEQIVDLKDYFDDENKTCYVYTIANLPADHFSRNEDGDLMYKNNDGTTVTLGTTWTALQAIELAADFKGAVTEEGKFQPQDGFVMSGLSGEITLTGTGADEVIVEVGRVAAKISMDVNVTKLIDKYTFNTTLMDFAYDGTYLPNVEAMQIYLTYVDSTTVITGEPDEYDNTFFTYNRYAWYLDDADEPKESTYTAQVLAKNEDGTIQVDDSGNAVYTDGATYPAFEVTGTPFYTYPIKWTSTDTHAPFIKIIIPWVKYKVPRVICEDYTTFDATAHTYELDPTNESYLDLIDKVENGEFPASFTMEFEGATYTIERLTSPAAMTSRKGDEYYYKISIPAFKDEESSSDCELNSNNWYKINLDISVLGSESDDASVIISGSTMGIYVVDWSNPDDDLGGDLDNGRYLSTAHDTYSINSLNTLTIPVISSHALSITGFGGTGNPTATFWKSGDAATEESGSLTYSTTSSEDNYFKITAAQNASSVTLDHTLLPFSTSFTTANAKDVAKITYKFRIQHADNANYYKDITVTQYPSVYVSVIQSASNTVFLNGKKYSDRPTVTNNNSFALGTLGQGQVSGTTLTVIAVSSLAGMQSTYPDWVIGDPTVKLSSKYPYSPYYTTQEWLENDLGDASNDYIANYWYAATDRSDFIAPKIMMASGYGANTGKGSWKTNAERCASYQEDGYPAGRWRLPTEAEILFGYTLGNKGLIPQPFQSSGYWANSGRYFDGSFHDGSSTQSRSVRCVYDLWYWGDDPVYTGTAAQSWQGFHADAKN